jgi:hypothetical protein
MQPKRFFLKILRDLAHHTITQALLQGSLGQTPTTADWLKTEKNAGYDYPYE